MAERGMHGRRGLKDALYGQVEHLLKGLASAKRLELVELLCQAPKTVEVLAAEAQITEKLASAHLRALRLANLVETEKHGRHVIYRIACADVAALLVAARQLAEDRSFELQHRLRDMAMSAEPWEQADAVTLLRKAKKGDVTVIDVRPSAEYAERHLPHAMSVPLEELKRRLKQLPKDKPVVAYCRGPFCLMSADAVAYSGEAGPPFRRDAGPPFRRMPVQWREGLALSRRSRSWSSSGCSAG